MVESKLNKVLSLSSLFISPVPAVMCLQHEVLGKRLNKLRLTFFSTFMNKDVTKPENICIRQMRILNLLFVE